MNAIPFNNFFPGSICINRDSRLDRWRHVVRQCDLHNINLPSRFRAHDGILVDGVPNGNAGCTASHRGVLEIIADQFGGGWCLVLEDDFEIVPAGEKCLGGKRLEWDHAKDRLPFHDQWLKMMPEIPDDWDMLFLGASYAEPPIARVSEHIIKCGRMMTTSSYAITAKFARKICPHIYGVGPIDSLMSGFYRDANVYCFTPRLMVQYTNMSDLCDREMNNSMSMLDPNHEAMVPWNPK